MIPISNTFRAELDQIIRRRGRCQMNMLFASGGSVQINENNIQKVEMHGTGDPLSRQLPTEECTITLIDFQELWSPTRQSGGYYESAQSGMTMQFRFGIETESGTVEWMPEYIVYEMNGSIVWKNYTATFKGIRDLQRLTGQFNRMAWTDDTLHQLAESVLASQKVGGVNPYEPSYDLDDNLYDVPVLDNAVLPDMSAKDALLAIALSGGDAVKTSYDNVVTIRDYWDAQPELNPAFIKELDILENPTVEVLPKLRYNIVTYLSDVRDSEQRMTDVFKASGNQNITAQDEPLFLKFDSPILASSFLFSSQTNIAALQYNLYRTGIEVTRLTRTNSNLDWSMTGRAEKAETVSATRYDLADSSDVGTEDEELSGPLINDSIARGIGIYRGLYLRNTRYLYTFNYRGDPSVEPLDILRCELTDGTIHKFIVVDHKFTYEHGFSGQISMRRIDIDMGSHTFTTAVSDFAVSDEAVSDES